MRGQVASPGDSKANRPERGMEMKRGMDMKRKTIYCHKCGAEVWDIAQWGYKLNKCWECLTAFDEGITKRITGPRAGKKAGK